MVERVGGKRVRGPTSELSVESGDGVHKGGVGRPQAALNRHEVLQMARPQAPSHKTNVGKAIAL